MAVCLLREAGCVHDTLAYGLCVTYKQIVIVFNSCLVSTKGIVQITVGCTPLCASDVSEVNLSACK